MNISSPRFAAITSKLRFRAAAAPQADYNSSLPALLQAGVLLSLLTLALMAVFIIAGRLLPASGSQIAYMSERNGNYEIMLMDLRARLPVNLTQTPARDRFPAWSPDGSQIAFHSDRGSADRPFASDFEIYVMNAEGQNVRQLTDNNFDDAMPAWSPDGSQIVFHADQGSPTTGLRNWDLYVMDADGGNLRLLVGDAEFGLASTEVMPDWSPDGSQIAFVSNRDGDFEIYIADVASGAVRQISDNTATEWGPVWSPDGNTLAFESDRSTNFDLYLLDLQRETIRRLTTAPADEFSAAWMATGDRIAFAAEDEHDFEIYAIDIAGGQPQRLTLNETVDRAPVWRP